MIYNIAGVILLIGIVMFAMTLELLKLKVALFAILVIGAALRLTGSSKAGSKIHLLIVSWTGCFVFLSFVFILLGLFNGYQGAVKQIQIYIFWPIVYTLILVFLANEKSWDWVHKTLIISTLLMSVFTVALILSLDGWLPIGILETVIFEDDTARVGFRDGHSRVTFPGIASFPFILPYTISCYVLSGSRNRITGINQKPFLLPLASGAAVVAAFACGRRAIWISVITTLAVLFLTGVLSNRLFILKNLSKLVVLIVGLILLLGFSKGNSNFNLETTISNLANAFDFSYYSESFEAVERRYQFDALLKGWSESPLIGHGHGAYVLEVIRDFGQPWSYELSYIALLFQVGGFGLLAYALMVGWIYKKGVDIVMVESSMSPMMFSSLVGMTMMLFANATNPYLSRFDGLWMVFHPLGIINFCLLSRTGSIHRNCNKFSESTD